MFEKRLQSHLLFESGDFTDRKVVWSTGSPRSAATGRTTQHCCALLLLLFHKILEPIQQHHCQLTR